ncbi:hypothetical protein GBAR_LOCUS17452 [Geodia barretti]|nr:hypothetical protein GBAR_LOCUS17452 [Geodia barretti]
MALKQLRLSLCRQEIPQTPIHCVLYGRRGVHADGAILGSLLSRCPFSVLVCSELKQEVDNVADIFQLEPMDSGELCRVGSSSANVLVFAYPHYTVCSRVTLAQLQDFMVFTKEEMNIQPSTMDLDIAPFLYDNEELLAMGSPPSELQQAVRTRVPQLNGRYAWIRDPLRSWSWTENIWNTRLLHCAKGAVESRGLHLQLVSFKLPGQPTLCFHRTSA